MKVGTKLNDNTQGMIIFKDNRPPIKCIFEGKKILLHERCKGCGSNEVKNYKCAHCGNNI